MTRSDTCVVSWSLLAESECAGGCGGAESRGQWWRGGAERPGQGQEEEGRQGGPGGDEEDRGVAGRRGGERQGDRAKHLNEMMSISEHGRAVHACMGRGDERPIHVRDKTPRPESKQIVIV